MNDGVILKMLPDVDLSSLPQKTLNVKVTKPIILNLPFIGRPIPEIEWRKMTDDDNYTVVQDDLKRIKLKNTKTKKHKLKNPKLKNTKMKKPK